MDCNYQAIGNRIRKSRKEKGWNQADLAELLDITPSYMSDI